MWSSDVADDARTRHEEEQRGSNGVKRSGAPARTGSGMTRGRRGGGRRSKVERQMRASGVGASGGDGGPPELVDEVRGCRCKETGQRGDRAQGGDGGLALGSAGAWSRGSGGEAGRGEGIGRRGGDREGDGDREDRAKPFLAAGVRVWRRAGNERERDAEEGVGLGLGGAAGPWAKLGWLDRLLGSLLSLMNNKIEQRKERKEREVRGKICAWG